MTDLPTALRALADDQPLQPADRLSTVTGQARRVRRNRRLASGLATVALLVPAGVLALGSGGTDDLQPASTSLLHWPDRSTAEDRGVAQGALAEWTWRGREGALLAQDVRWLYRGRVDVPEGSDLYVAVFTAFDGAKHSLVTARTAMSQVDAHGDDVEDDDPSSSPWTLDTTDLSTGAAPDHVGLYLPYLGTGTVGSYEHLNVVFLLAGPDARSMQWRSMPLPGAPDVATTGNATAPNGVFVTPPVSLTGPVEVTTGGADLGTGPVSVGFELGTPSLRAPARPEVPAGWDDEGGGSGQVSPGDGGGYFSNLNGNRRLPMSVFARCYGGGALGFTLYPLQTSGPIGPDGEAEIAVSSQNAPPVARGSVPCDGSSHRAFAPARVRTDGYELQLTPDRLQAYAYVLASPR